MSVTRADRELARLMDSDTAFVVRRGVAAARRIGSRMIARSIAAFREGSNPVEPALELFEEIEPLLSAGMTAGFLMGMRRTKLIVKALPQERFELESDPYATMRRRMLAALLISEDSLRHTAEYHTREARLVANGAGARLRERLQRAIVEVNAEGLHVREGVKRLRLAFAAAGVTPRNSFTLENLFRTQAQLSYAAGRYHAEQDPAVRRILWGYKYVTVGDERVRRSHLALEGVTMEKDDPAWNSIYPPNGWACRCSLIPLFKPVDVVRPEVRKEIEGVTVTPGPDPEFSFHPGKVGATGQPIPRLIERPEIVPGGVNAN